MRSRKGEQEKALVLIILILIGVIVDVNSQVQQCSEAFPSNTTSFPFCLYSYNNCTETAKRFQYCSYCGDSQIAISKDGCRTLVNSTLLSDCNAKCQPSQSISKSSSSSWVGVVVPILISLVAILIVCCICRKFMRDASVEYSLPEAVMMQGEAVRLDEVVSERRFSSPSDQPIALEHEPIPYRHWEPVERKEGYTPEDDECIICLEPAITSRLACSHRYHTACIRQWFNVHEYCPTCKLSQIRNVNIFCNMCKQKQYSLPLWLFKRGGMESICDECRLISHPNSNEG